MVLIFVSILIESFNVLSLCFCSSPVSFFCDVHPRCLTWRSFSDTNKLETNVHLLSSAARRGVLIETAAIANGVIIIILVATVCCMLLYLVTVPNRFQRAHHFKVKIGDHFDVKNGQYIYQDCSAVVTTKKAVPVAVLSADALVCTV